MTQEEKARAYDEALERARALRQEAIDKEYAIDYVKDYEAIFPQLAESEDEMVRQWLLDYAIEMIAGLESDISRSTYDGIKGHDPEAEAELAQWRKARAYLERQKDLAAIPDELVKNYKLFCENGRREVAVLINAINGINEQKEQKPAEWSAKGRRGRIGSTPEHIRKKAENFLSKMEPPYDADDICSAYETGAMENANSSWSEEDEKMLRTIISDGSRGVELDSKQISWLKSLRPQPKKGTLHRESNTVA